MRASGLNGEDWGLYLAVESIEEAFLERNYGSDYGELYKPDSMSMGGGRGNGNKFDMADWTAELNDETISQIKTALEEMDDTRIAEILGKLGYSSLADFLSALENAENMEDILNGIDIRELFTGRVNPMGGGMMPSDRPENGGFPKADENQGEQMPRDGQNGMQPPNGEMSQIPGMGSDDVKLIYSDDEYDSYSNIFNNAKTDITKADKDRLIASLK